MPSHDFCTSKFYPLQLQLQFSLKIFLAPLWLTVYYVFQFAMLTLLSYPICEYWKCSNREGLYICSQSWPFIIQKRNPGHRQINDLSRDIRQTTLNSETFLGSRNSVLATSHKLHLICDDRSDGKFSLKMWAFLGLLKNICCCLIFCRRGNKLCPSLSLHRFMNQLRMGRESERWILLVKLDWRMQCRLVVETAYLSSIPHTLILVLLPGLPAHPHPQHTLVLCKGECVQRKWSCAAALPHPCESWQ